MSTAPRTGGLSYQDLAGFDAVGGSRPCPRAKRSGGSGSVVVEGRVEQLGLVLGLERELLLAAPPGPAPGWWPGRQSQVTQDALRHGIVLDDRDQSQGAAAARADQDVDRERPRQQPRPVQPARAVRVVGATRRARRDRCTVAADARTMAVGVPAGTVLTDLRDAGYSVTTTASGCTPGPGESCVTVEVPARSLRVLASGG